MGSEMCIRDSVCPVSVPCLCCLCCVCPVSPPAQVSKVRGPRAPPFLFSSFCLSWPSPLPCFPWALVCVLLLAGAWAFASVSAGARFARPACFSLCSVPWNFERFRRLSAPRPLEISALRRLRRAFFICSFGACGGPFWAGAAFAVRPRAPSLGFGFFFGLAFVPCACACACALCLVSCVLCLSCVCPVSVPCLCCLCCVCPAVSYTHLTLPTILLV